ncbi:MAG: hypothetical protein PHU85_16790 [Phycisphaerae bacterium]|nr:hypothetical protein [Phycisphaerae bacterium]
MSFTVSNVQVRANALSGETIIDADAIAWCWDAVFRMDSRLWPEKTEDYASAVADTFYDLPSDFLYTVLVEDDDGDEYTDYTIRSGKIKFEDDDTYTLTYRGTPTKYTATTGGGGTISMQDIFQEPIAKYLCSRFYSQDDDTNSSAARWMNEYRADMNAIVSIMQLDNEVLQVKEVW